MHGSLWLKSSGVQKAHPTIGTIVSFSVMKNYFWLGLGEKTRNSLKKILKIISRSQNTSYEVRWFVMNSWRNSWWFVMNSWFFAWFAWWIRDDSGPNSWFSSITNHAFFSAWLRLHHDFHHKFWLFVINWIRNKKTSSLLFNDSSRKNVQNELMRSHVPEHWNANPAPLLKLQSNRIPSSGARNATHIIRFPLVSVFTCSPKLAHSITTWQPHYLAFPVQNCKLAQTKLNFDRLWTENSWTFHDTSNIQNSTTKQTLHSWFDWN